MSFETIEAYLHELEALKCYPEVKEKLRKKASAAQKLGVELGKVSNELKALKEFEIKSIDGRNLTLEQARDEFLKDKETEIERKASEKFEVLRADLDAKMPGLVHDKFVETLGKRSWPKEIASTIQEKAKEIADEILKDKKKWPNWFNEFYLEEVSARLNAEFNQRVENGATERAEAKLAHLTRVEWPKWYEANIKPKIEENVIRMLGDHPWSIGCDMCGTRQGIQLTEQNISDLLTLGIGYIEKECTNPNCTGLIRRHRIRTFLRDLILAIKE